MAMTPEQRSTYIAQQMSQFQGKQLRSLFPKGQAGVGGGGGGTIHSRVSLTVSVSETPEGERGGLQLS